MKLLMLILCVTFAYSSQSFADCGVISCWDSCTSNWKNVYGDRCETEWNSSGGCWESVGTCNGSGGGEICDGQTTSCWDSCTGGWKTVHGNRCETAWSSAGGCWEAIGTCN